MIESINNNINFISIILIILLLTIVYGIGAICWHLADIKEFLKDNRELLKLIKKNSSTYKEF